MQAKEDGIDGSMESCESKQRFRTFPPTLGNPRKRDSHIPILTAAEKQNL
jgi:hypothetical protein